MIRGQGNSKPQVFFIADMPHGEDFKTEYALTGFAGQMIDGFCRDHGLYLQEQYRTCLIKESEPRILREAEATQEASKELIAKYSNILIDEINDLQPNLLVPLGELSFNFFTGLTGIRKFRGSVLPASGNFSLNKPVKVLPILGPHPYINQEYRLRFLSRIDFGKIKKNMHEGPVPDNLYNIWVARSSTALRSFFDRAYQRCVENKSFVVFDIETYMQIPICISFCFDGFESVCIPLIDQSIDFDNRVLMMELVARMLASPLMKVNQNIKYDWKILERWCFAVNNVGGDSMLAASCLYCEFAKNLGFLTSIYTDIPYFKDEGKEFDPDKGKRDRYYLYNAKDSLATHQIYTQQQQEVVEKGVQEVYGNLISLMPIYKKMEDRGIRIDEEKRDNLLAKYESLYHVQELMLRRLLGRTYFNALSPKQCKEAIFDELGYSKLQGMKSTTSGEPSTDEESLDMLAARGEAKKAPSTGPIVLEAIIAARKIHKVIELLELPLYPDKRFRAEFNLAGTKNARTSAGETTDQFVYMEPNGKILVTNLGHSMQNIGKHGFMIDQVTYGRDVRSIFVPSPGYRFVEIDLSQAEARVDAVLSGNFDILKIFDGPVGIHKLTGSWVYGCDPLEIKKDILIDSVDRYHMAKTVRHAGERNMGAERLVMMTQRPLSECTQILNTFHKYQPEIRQVFHREIIKAVDAPTHCLIAPNGRRRDFFDRITKKTYNDAISFLPQAIVSDQTKFAGILPTFSTTGIYSWAALLTEQHDGVLVEVKQGREEEFGSLYKKNIERPIDFRLCTLSRDYELIIPAEVSMGEDWNSLEKLRI